MLQRSFRTPWIASILSGILKIIGWWFSLPLLGDPVDDLALLHNAARAQLRLDRCRTFFRNRSVSDEISGPISLTQP
jgi:hypothetical protein